VVGLRFDAAKHTYEDLLVTISPDLQPDAAGQQAIIGNLKINSSLLNILRRFFV
jgi:hypothetical protein